MSEKDQDRGPADPDTHGGSEDDGPAIAKNADKGSAAEVIRLLKRVAPTHKNT